MGTHGKFCIRGQDRDLIRFRKICLGHKEGLIEKYCRLQRMVKVTELGKKIKVKAEEHKICISAEGSNARDITKWSRISRDCNVQT